MRFNLIFLPQFFCSFAFLPHVPRRFHHCRGTKYRLGHDHQQMKLKFQPKRLDSCSRPRGKRLPERPINRCASTPMRPHRSRERVIESEASDEKAAADWTAYSAPPQFDYSSARERRVRSLCSLLRIVCSLVHRRTLRPVSLFAIGSVNGP